MTAFDSPHANHAYAQVLFQPNWCMNLCEWLVVGVGCETEGGGVRCVTWV